MDAFTEIYDQMLVIFKIKQPSSHWIANLSWYVFINFILKRVTYSTSW